ncbi:hypothetical protein [Sphingomonas sp. M1-B02]|uniref:hypothetical protein n=1 Tax=Sphingomonas sp. M1-B02 TaxID=3114300 RepID=UPI00223E9BB5|nr:hypothetical protein [Sphingomonas sp. S6-11]UZK67704.1 hypothetical protein OKW87_07715 [Sphingomonas sp. S6-11]
MERAYDRASRRFDRLPAELPAAERDLWVQLTPELREQAVKRLGAIRKWLDARRGGARSPRGLTDRLAAEAGVSRKRFYELLSACDPEPTLAGLGVRASAPLRRRSTIAGDGRQRVEEVIRRCFFEDPEMATEKVVKRVGELDLERSPARTSVLRWLTDARRLARPLRAFGEHVALDVAWLAMCDTDGQAHTLAVVIDEGTGFVLGWEVAGRADGLAAYRTALARAGKSLVRMAVGGAPAPRRDLNLVVFMLDEWDPVDRLRFTSHLPEGVPQRSIERGRAVRPLLRHFSGRLDRIPLQPQPPLSVEGLPVASRADARRLACKTIDAHNQAILVRIAGPEDEARCKRRMSLASLLKDAARRRH